MIRLTAILIPLALSACAPSYCNDTNEDWPGVPRCHVQHSAFSPYEPFIERCEATGGKYQVGPNYEPICEASK